MEEQEILCTKGLSDSNMNFFIVDFGCTFMSYSYFCIHKILLKYPLCLLSIFPQKLLGITVSLRHLNLFFIGI